MKELMQLSSYNTERSGAFFQSSDSVKHLQVVSYVSCMLSHENFLFILLLIKQHVSSLQINLQNIHSANKLRDFETNT